MELLLERLIGQLLIMELLREQQQQIHLEHLTKLLIQIFCILHQTQTELELELQHQKMHWMLLEQEISQLD